MRNFWVYSLLFLVALAGGAFLWGLIYALWLPPVPHHKFVRYGALLTAVIVLAFWARRRVSRSALGLQTNVGSFLVQTLSTFAVTVALLTPWWIFLLILDARMMVDPWERNSELGYRIATYLTSAMIVAAVEELYFRGLLLSRTSRSRAPLVASALFYAGIHFLNPAPGPMLNGQWDGGWVLLIDAVLEMPTQWAEQMPRLCLLFLVGLGLGMLRLRFNCLALCIGAHAAMVFSLKLFQYLTSPGDSASAWLGTDVLGGWVATVWISILLFGLWRSSIAIGNFPGR